MAHASRKHFGPGAQGKGDGTGAMTTIDTADIPDNMILSNRDKAQHSDQRGLDSKAVQTDQYRDHSANRRVEDEERPDGRADLDDGEADA
ncbi:hypothetical protein [Rubellimicrobium aerolatum]|uniref:Uncharacterized protein n=1 Tax=Rubellimicrobium aerolatum TaxID=490979 RepID=A0ABW0S999_9RHOB|nr:hypothetical protein [Rubellimicrobium aerolatum]MBP1804851.1 hypothetical protein [Rubellimicrobium aerolatum]